MSVWAVIAAAGRGTRLGPGSDKMFLTLAGRPLLAHVLGAFERCGAVDHVAVVCSASDVDRCRTLAGSYGFAKVRLVLPGGEERQDSVFAGLSAVARYTRERDEEPGWACEIVVVHDGARPLVSKSEIESSVAAAREFGAAVVAVPVKDTVLGVGPDGTVIQGLDRRLLWAALTPQAFRFNLLMEAHARAQEDSFLGTDDAGLVQRIGLPVKVVRGRYENLKITTPEDVVMAEALLARRERAAGGEGPE